MSSSSSLLREKLHRFSLKHYTYINQIFGDITVREILTEVYPSESLILNTEEAGTEFLGSYHHIVSKRENPSELVYCSAMEGHQNIDVNINDTLCQSYSLYYYLNHNSREGIPEGCDIKTQIQRQMLFIEMYRSILSNRKFQRALQDILSDQENKNLWVDFTKSDTSSDVPIKMKLAPLIKKIRETLTEWKKYGYGYFINKGYCVPEKD